MTFRLHMPRVLAIGALCSLWGAIGFAGFALSSCQKAHEQKTVAPAVEAGGSDAGAVVSPPGAPAAGQPVPGAPAKPQPPTPEQIQIAQDIQDNAEAHVLAQRFVANPDELARQSAVCGPNNYNMTVRYMTRKGPPSDELRAFAVACIAKDIALDAPRAQIARGGGGVLNTHSL